MTKKKNNILKTSFINISTDNVYVFCSVIFLVLGIIVVCAGEQNWSCGLLSGLLIGCGMAIILLYLSFHQRIERLESDLEYEKQERKSEHKIWQGIGKAVIDNGLAGLSARSEYE